MWTAHKARFIERYLYYFVLVTKHGTYIDGFAGPQQPDDPDMWTAKRVLESEPRRLRRFYLFDISPAKMARLQDLKQVQRPPDRSKKEPKRTIHVTQGDFNSLVRELLHYDLSPIGQEASHVGSTHAPGTAGDHHNLTVQASHSKLHNSPPLREIAASIRTSSEAARVLASGRWLDRL